MKVKFASLIVSVLSCVSYASSNDLAQVVGNQESVNNIYDNIINQIKLGDMSIGTLDKTYTNIVLGSFELDDSNHLKTITVSNSTFRINLVFPFPGVYTPNLQVKYDASNCKDIKIVETQLAQTDNHVAYSIFKANMEKFVLIAGNSLINNSQLKNYCAN